MDTSCSGKGDGREAQTLSRSKNNEESNMCQQLTYLVYRGQRRFIAICEHGTFHVAWQRATLHANHDEFQTIAGFLERAETVAQPGQYYAGHCHAMTLDAQGYYQVWLWGMGFYFAPGDFKQFVAMVVEAQMALDDGYVAVTSKTRLNQPTSLQPPIFLN